MPEEIDQRGAVEMLEYARLAFKALKVHTQKIMDAENALSAALQILVQKFPELAARYERALAEQSVAHPTRPRADQFDPILERLDDWLAKLKAQQKSKGPPGYES